MADKKAIRKDGLRYPELVSAVYVVKGTKDRIQAAVERKHPGIYTISDLLRLAIERFLAELEAGHMFDQIHCDPRYLPDDPPVWVEGYRYQTTDLCNQLVCVELGKLGEPLTVQGEVWEDFHGDVEFSARNGDTGEKVVYVARYTDGKLARIWREVEA